MTAHPPLLTPEQRAGLLVAVISGGRPNLAQRPTSRLLPDLAGHGYGGPLWVVDSRDAPAYEHDPHPLLTYPHQWAYEYALTHWMSPDKPPTPDGFLGGFAGRDYVMQFAHDNGYWGVLQLDDNIIRLAFLRGTKTSQDIVQQHGGLHLYADTLGALALSTNARMIGASLNAVIPNAAATNTLARAGYPYSLFVERTADREHWLGPFEEDITQALLYDQRPDDATAALVPLLTYAKEHQSKTGMRRAYDQTRSVQLQRLLPQQATVGIRKTRANGKGTPRVFHSLRPIRTPLTVTDPALYGKTRDRVAALRRDWYAADLAANRAKVDRRTTRHAEKTGAPRDRE